jgi:hypothetical protein
VVTVVAATRQQRIPNKNMAPNPDQGTLTLLVILFLCLVVFCALLLGHNRL